MKLKLAATLLLMTAASLVSSAHAQEKKQMAFVVNAASDFWKLAEAGVKKAQGELPNYEVSLKYPAQGTAALQNALMPRVPNVSLNSCSSSTMVLPVT